MPRRSFIATVAVGLWAVSAVLLLILLRMMHTDVLQLFEKMEVDLPGFTVLALDAASFVSTNLLIIAGAIALSLVPFLLGARGKTAAKVYLGLTFLAVLGIGATWFAANQPLNSVKDNLDTPAMPFGR